jgi:hypothetical protein
MEDLKIWIDRQKRLEGEIENKENQLRDVERKICELRAKFKIGQIIYWRKHRGRIVGYETWCVDEVTYIVIQIKKDGTDGKKARVYPFYDPTSNDPTTNP